MGGRVRCSDRKLRGPVGGGGGGAPAVPLRYGAPLEEDVLALCDNDAGGGGGGGADLA